MELTLKSVLQIVDQTGYQPIFQHPSIPPPEQGGSSRLVIPVALKRRVPHPCNYNHPKKGDRIKVEPIRKLPDIQQIKENLAGQPRNLLLFVLGINTNLRASDLVRLTVGQVRHLNPLDDLELREKKTGKLRRLNLNESVTTAISKFLATLPEDVPDSFPLFPSERGDKALTVPTVSRMVKGWCRKVRLHGNYGSHTLRKTWGYHQRATFGVGIAELMVCFNHSAQRQTLDYLGVQPEEVKRIYANQI